MRQEILILGSSPAALQAARDLADCGLKVILSEEGSFLGDGIQLDEPAYLQDSRLLDLIRHPLVQAWTSTEIRRLTQRPDRGWEAVLVHQPRYVDLDRCTACGACLEVCPVTLPGTDQKAIHLGGQPGCAVIIKTGQSPCSSACPAGIPVQGYVALTAAGRYTEAYQLIHQSLPFPSVCGRVCNHYCEQSCTRASYDQPVNIMALKRFVTDFAYQELDRDALREDLVRVRENRPVKEQKVAVIGAGPAGLTAARDLVREGYPVTVFDAHPAAGGMMRVGIPPHRLDYDQLAWEIEQIELEGVALQLNTWVEDIPGLLEAGYAAVLIATGAHRAVKIPLEGADHPDNWLSLDFLKRVCLGEKIDLQGRSVIVLGGGDVAMDAARSAVRLGDPAVKIVCRGMRASAEEVQQAEQEGIELLQGRVFKRVVLQDGRIAGVECLEAEVGGIVEGKRQFRERPGTEHLVEGDLVIWAVGQRPDFSFLPQDGSILQHSEQGLQADERMMTRLEGVFTAGDVRRGTTFFVVDAVGEGHRAAREMQHFLAGTPGGKPAELRPKSTLEGADIQLRISQRKEADRPRVDVPTLSTGARKGNFKEVDQTLRQKDARLESGRCLACGPCSECQACVEVCEPGAINHLMLPEEVTLHFDAVLGKPESGSSQLPAGLVPFPGESPLAGSAAAYQVLCQTGMPAGSGTCIPLPETSRQVGRSGLVLCQCGGLISRSVDTTALREEAPSWPEIVDAIEVPYSCTEEGKDAILSFIAEHHLDQVLLAACSCCDLDRVCYSCTYQRVRCKQNLGIYGGIQPQAGLAFVNVREMCASVHPRSRKKATQAARTLIRAELAGLPDKRSTPAGDPSRPTRTLVVGEGASADSCLGALEGLGLEAARVKVLSGKLTRSGGRFQTMENGKKIQGDCLVLAPASGAELDYLVSAIGIGGHDLVLPEKEESQAARRLGILICSPGEDPAVAGRGAAVQAAGWMAWVKHGNARPFARVDPSLCRSCGTCQDVCGLGIPEIIQGEEGSWAWINPYLCLDCGVCASHCPSGAIESDLLSDRSVAKVLAEVLQ